MNKKQFFSFFISLCFALQGNLFAQETEVYQSMVKQADSLYDIQSYQASAKRYIEAFEYWGKGFINDRYNAACSMALCGMTDSAFSQLIKISGKGNYSNLYHLTDDSDLNSLHQDERWKQVVQQVRANKVEAEKDLMLPLVHILDTVYLTDQRDRRALSGLAEKYGWDSPEIQAKWDTINYYDSVNLIKVTQILDEHGWLGSDKVGGRGNTAIFLVIQHADLAVQLKYLPMMREAVLAGNARGASLALLEDRVALRQGKRQIYGSQVGRNQETGEHYVLPLDEPRFVDKRREAVGLPPLAEYVSRWGIDWDPIAYEKILPELEEKRKKKDE